MKNLFLSFCLVVTVNGFAQNNEYSKPIISSVGVGTVNAFPNAAQITISFLHTKPVLREAINENQKTLDEVYKIVRKYVNDTLDIKTSLISTNKATKWDAKTNKEIFIGFQSSQKLIFTLKELDRMQDFTEELMKTKFNKIEKVAYFNTEASEFMKQAEELAVNDAIETTKRLAKSSDVKIGKILFIQTNKSPNDNSNNSVNAYNFDTFGKGMGGRGVSSSGELIKYIATVHINTEIIE